MLQLAGAAQDTAGKAAARTTPPHPAVSSKARDQASGPEPVLVEFPASNDAVGSLAFAHRNVANTFAGETIKDGNGNPLCVLLKATDASMAKALRGAGARIEVVSGAADSPNAPPLQPRTDRGKGPLVRYPKKPCFERPDFQGVDRRLNLDEASLGPLENMLIARFEGVTATDISSAHPSGRFRLTVFVEGYDEIRGILSDVFGVKSARAGMPDMRKISREEVRLTSDVRHLPHLGDEKARRLRAELGVRPYPLRPPQLSVGLFLRYALHDAYNVMRLCGSYGTNGQLVSMMSEREWQNIFDFAKAAYSNTTNMPATEENLSKWEEEQTLANGPLPQNDPRGEDYAARAAVRVDPCAPMVPDGPCAPRSTPPQATVKAGHDFAFAANADVAEGSAQAPPANGGLTALGESFARAAAALSECMRLAAAMEQSTASAPTPPGVRANSAELKMQIAVQVAAEAESMRQHVREQLESLTARVTALESKAILPAEDCMGSPPSSKRRCLG